MVICGRIVWRMCRGEVMVRYCTTGTSGVRLKLMVFLAMPVQAPLAKSCVQNGVYPQHHSCPSRVNVTCIDMKKRAV